MMVWVIGREGAKAELEPDEYKQTRVLRIWDTQVFDGLFDFSIRRYSPINHHRRYRHIQG